MPQKVDATWDLTPLAKSDSDRDLRQSRQQSTQAAVSFAHKWQNRTDYQDQPAVLLEALIEYEHLMRCSGVNSREWYYFSLRTAQDQLDPKLKGLATSADEVATQLGNTIQFFTLTLAQLPQTKQAKHLEFAGLQPYHHYLKRLFAEGAYTLSEGEEKVLNLLAASSHDAWVRMTSSFLTQEKAQTLAEDGSEVTLGLPELLSLTSNKNKPVRDAAAQHIHRIVAKHAPVATEELNALLSHKKSVDQLRGFTRPDQSRHMADDIDSSAVDALLSAVESRFDIPHRFYTLKAKLLHQENLAYHERNVEYGQLNQHYTFEQAADVIKRVFKDLDPQFAQIFDQFVTNGQLDVYPRPGKAGGAFCAHALLTQPSYVLLNHTNRLQDVLTLAHEMGHAINNELMRAKQHALNFDTPLATAEVASTFMEDFVLEHIAAESEPEAQLAINMMKLNDDISSIFRQVAAYRFEQQLHQEYHRQSYLPQEYIGQIFQKHMASYMGAAIEPSEGSQNWWVYWSHFRNFFYVYSYASGLLISKSLQAMVRQEPSSISRVKDFLSAGSSASPKDIFADLGVYIEQPDFWQQGLEAIDKLLCQTEKLADLPIDYSDSGAIIV